MADRCSNGVDSFKAEHGPDLAEVTTVHKAEAQEVGAMVKEREMGIKSKTKTAKIISFIKSCLTFKMYIN